MDFPETEESYPLYVIFDKQTELILQKTQQYKFEDAPQALYWASL